MTDNNWDFVLAKAAGAEWKPGLREIFDYRDLGIKAATKGDYVAHIVKANGKKMKDTVQHGHVHDGLLHILFLENDAIEEHRVDLVFLNRRRHGSPGHRIVVIDVDHILPGDDAAHGHHLPVDGVQDLVAIDLDGVVQATPIVPINMTAIRISHWRRSLCFVAVWTIGVSVKVPRAGEFRGLHAMVFQ